MATSKSAEGPPERRPDCSIRYEGEELPAVAGEPVAVTLSANGKRVLSRSIKYHRPRSFFCLAGHCNGCLMRVDGVPNVKSCRTPARDGLVVERQNAFPSGSFDVLGAADWFFPKGMDHHTLMTGSAALNAILRRVVREVGGLGTLPDEERPLADFPRSRSVRVDVAIVGAGPAGLSAAIGIAERVPGASILVADGAEKGGGSLRTHPDFGPARADALVEKARALGVSLHLCAPAFGYYPEAVDGGGGNGVLALDDGGALVRVSARHVLHATGGFDVNALFAANDRPGVIAGRAAARLLLEHGVVPGKRPLVLGEGEYAEALAGALVRAGCDVRRGGQDGERPVEARGLSWVNGMVLEKAGATRRVGCDVIAVVEPCAPASELARMMGAEVAFSIEGGGFAVRTDEQGRCIGGTGGEGVWAAGDVCGYRGPRAAEAEGARVGAWIATALLTSSAERAAGAGTGGR